MRTGEVMTEREKMLAGKLYDPTDKELAALRIKVRRLCEKYNVSSCEKPELRDALLHEILGKCGENTYMEPDIRFDYGCNTYTGKNFFSNYNCVILDVAEVRIGDDVMFGPNVTIATPVHPLLARERKMRTRADGSKYDLEYAKPITIEDGVWLAAGVTVTGGVTIGAGAVIGAGSVVTRDIPAGVVAAGVPCRVIRKLSEEDYMGSLD